MFVPYVPSTWDVAEALGLLLLYALGIGIVIAFVLTIIVFNRSEIAEKSKSLKSKLRGIARLISARKESV